jgi:hypothetical protein
VADNHEQLYSFSASRVLRQPGGGSLCGWMGSGRRSGHSLTGPDHRPRRDDYYAFYARVYAPGYLETDRVVRYETEVYDAREGGRLVWSGTTESINPASAAAVNKEIAHVVVSELVKSGVTQAH